MTTGPSAHAFLLTCMLLGVSASHGQTLTCTDGRDGPLLSIAAAPGYLISMKMESLKCAAGITFIPSRTNTGNGFLLIPPAEPELNAHYNVYYAMFNHGKYRHIGELPVSAELNSYESFINIFQQGGSIYLEKYKLTYFKVEASPEVLEMVIDGSVCIQDSHDVWNTTLNETKTCGRTARASFKHPICLLNNNGKATLSRLSACKAIQNKK